MVLLSPLLAFLFTSFSLGEILRFKIVDAASIGPLDIALLAIIVIWFLKVKKTNYRLKTPIIIFAILGLISLLINVNKFSSHEILVSSLYLFRWIFYSLFYFVMVDIGRKYEKNISKLILSSGVIVMTFGFLQFFLYPSLKNLYYLGWDEHMYRLFSTYLDPNFTGVILVLFFVFVFIMRDKLFKNKWLGTGILCLTFISIILTYSRGALLMFAACTLTYSIMQRNVKIVIGLILLMISVFVILSPRFYLENNNLLRTVSTKERLGTSEKALQIFIKNPMGVGFDTYRYARQKYGETDLSKFGPSHSGAGVDNSIIFVAVTTGILGLISYLYLLYSTFKLGLSKKNKYGLILVISLAGLIVNSLFINSLFYSFVMVWMWSLAGLTESSSRE